jgi:Undecaprenyl-phosphate glucose phosphotransferase
MPTSHQRTAHLEEFNALDAPVLSVVRNPSLLLDLRAAAQSKPISAALVRGFARIVDVVLIAIVGLVVAHSYVGSSNVVGVGSYLLPITLVSLLSVAAFELLGLYSLRSLASYIRKLPSLMLGLTIAFGTLVVSLFFLKRGADVSRVWIAIWYAMSGVAILLARLSIATAISRWVKDGRLQLRAAIYGSSPITETLLHELESDHDQLIRIAGIFDDRDPTRAPRQIAGYPHLGGIDALISMSRSARFDLVIVALPLTAEDRLQSVAYKLSVLPVDIKLPASVSAIRFSPRLYTRVGSVAMIDLHDRPITDWNAVSKWLFDKIIASVAVVLLAPVLALVALAVKLESKGPVLFRQKRYGFNNELIEVFKFRSMYIEQCDPEALQLVTRNDKRVTRVGRFIRKTSLDELPQLFNVILGDMSLVGPRPHAMQTKVDTQLLDQVVDRYYARHKVKPGITGWAQINGWRGETDTEEKIQKRVDCDLYYIENWSVFFDLYILLKTPYSLLNTKNAY